MAKLIHASDAQASTPRADNEKDLTTMIMDMETKHGKI